MGYAATKHAVVGLSTSLRIEAALAGVRVSVLCPGAVETPIADGGRFGKIITPMDPSARRRMWEMQRPISPEKFARAALNAVARNQAIIVIPGRWKIGWWFYRLLPNLFLNGARLLFAAHKKQLQVPPH